MEGGHELIEIKQHRLTHLLLLFVVVSLLESVWSCFYSLSSSSLRKMSDKDWLSKGGKAARRSPRQRGNSCAKPFKAPRLATKDIANSNDGEIQEITETENDRDILGRQEEAPRNNPYPKGIKLMSEREATECAQNGEVLGWSTDSSDGETVKEIATQTNQLSDTTGSTPDIFRSPDTGPDIVQGSNTVPVAQEERPKLTYMGVTHVDETEVQGSSSDSEDDVPVARLLRPKLNTTLTLEQIQDCKDGPKGDRAVGVTVAKLFDGVEFRGTVDSFRQVRRRYYYHITYTDGDEEEMSQLDLREGYLLGMSEEIEVQWALFKEGDKGKVTVETEEPSEGETSNEEGSNWDTRDIESELRKTKRKRIAKPKRTKKKKKKDLSGVVLPKSGDQCGGRSFR